VSAGDDVEGAMVGRVLQHFDLDALLNGSVEPDDLPPRYRFLAETVRAARPAPSDVPLPGEEKFVRALTAPIGASHEAPGRNIAILRPRRIPARVAAVAAAMLVGGATAAAATGSLPGPVQTAIARAVSHVGISIPGAPSAGSGHVHSPNVSGAPTTSTTVPANTFGLCTAYAAISKDYTDTSEPSLTNSPAFAALAAAAVKRGMTVQSYCAAAGSKPVGSNGRLASGKSTHSGTPANTFGLCTAYAAISKDFTDTSEPSLTNSPAFATLAAAAGKKGMTVQDYCAAAGSKPVGLSDRAANPGKPTDTGKPAHAGKPAQTGKPGGAPGKPSNPSGRSHPTTNHSHRGGTPGSEANPAGRSRPTDPRSVARPL
jgi:hypothetical protein